MIERRINRLSKNEQMFNNSVAIYQNALDNANFKHIINYTEKKRHKLKRKLTDQGKLLTLTLLLPIRKN